MPRLKKIKNEANVDSNNTEEREEAGKKTKPVAVTVDNLEIPAIDPATILLTPVVQPEEKPEVITTSSGRIVSPSKRNDVPAVSNAAEPWNEIELRKLREGITKYGQDNYEQIATHVKSRTLEQVKAHIQYLLKRKARSTKSRVRPAAPIEDWLNTINAKTSNETDYSYILAHVMGTAGNDQRNEQSDTSKRLTNYSNIYRYIAALMSGEEPTQLSAVESALVLDLLQGLSDSLQALDTTAQRELMLEKFKQHETEHAQKATLHNAAESATTERSLKRAELFTINPFNIPVKYLKFDKAEEQDIVE